MSQEALQQVVDLVKADPHGGASLSLYALVSTLRMEKGGYMYMLRKLRDLNPEHRRLAYGLMELMAEQGNRGEAWERALAEMDAAIRRG
ncbi:MAG: hypothetical protein PVF07_04530 [Thiogranum sp.]|jgi:hypothetical protein